jgi:hypothetical protein
MMYRRFSSSRTFSVVCGVLIAAAAPCTGMGQPAPAAVTAFNTYTAAVEARLAEQHQSPTAFLVPEDSTRLRKGELAVQQLTPSTGDALPGALLHHWRGTAFVAGAKATDFERLLRDFKAYPQEFSPQVLQARVLAQNGDHLQVRMRVRQRHVITVTMDTTYDVAFGRLDAQHGYSISRSTQISEMDSNGRALTASEEHGFLWRMNTYWSYEERDGGLYIQIESVSLTRSIPTGLAWAVGPFVESIPRESMEFTLHSACNALRRPLDQARVNQSAE